MVGSHAKHFMIVVYSSSRELYRGLKASITSLLEHNDIEKLYVLSLDDELPFEIPCNHEVVNISQQPYFPPDCPNIRSRFTILSLIRACVPDLIPEDKAIVLDVDLIVCDSLQPLWDIPLGDNWLAWCPEYYGQWNPFAHEYYFNFGVTVMNLAQMRKDNVVQRMVRELNTNSFAYCEQDCFNKLAGRNKSVPIPARFNESFCCGYSVRPAIVHYAGFSDWLTNIGMPRRNILDRYL